MMTPTPTNQGAAADQLYGDLLMIIDRHPQKFEVVVMAAKIPDNPMSGKVQQLDPLEQDLDYEDPFKATAIEISESQDVAGLKANVFGDLGQNMPDPKGFLIKQPEDKPKITEGTIVIMAEKVKDEIKEMNFVVDHLTPVGRNGQGGWIVKCWPFDGDVKDLDENPADIPPEPTNPKADEFIMRKN